MKGQALTISQECQREAELQEMLWDTELLRQHLERQRMKQISNTMRAMELQRAKDVERILAG